MNKKLSWVSKICFGIGAFGKDAVYAIVGTYLMMYLTDYRSVAPAFVGSLFMVARIWDAFNDPFMGMIVDNTRTRWGKFRPWILIGTILNAIVLVLLFLDNGLEGKSYLVWCSVFYILWGMTYTIMDIPYWSLVPALTEDENERSQISAIPRIFASCAWLVINSFGLIMVSKLGSGNDVRGFSILATIIAIVFIFASVVTCLTCKEQIVTPKAEKTSIKGMINVLFKNDQVKIVLGIALFFNIAYQLSNSFALFYFKYVAERTYDDPGNGILYPIYAAVAGFAQMGSMAVLPLLSKKIGKKVSFFMASFCPVVGFALLWVFGYLIPKNALAVGICSGIINVGIGFMLVFITVFLSEVVDYGEYKLGTRNESILFSMQTFVVKFAGAFSGFLSGIGLSLIGYEANQQQTVMTENGMRIIMFLIPAILSALCFLIYIKGYKLTPDFYREVRETIDINRQKES
ncbi:MAG: melibiose:sodium transporter MelB [Lachnospiraceae bacterium]|nr:melibiose:sodium transporter MelB [Lachnospiraceae bacterium]